MNIRTFTIDICGIFLSMALSVTIQEVIQKFSLFALFAAFLILFLSLNFFFAKFKQLSEGEEEMTGFGFVINILTLMCFAAMPFFINDLVGLMGTQVCLRISDVILIMYNNKWKIGKIDKMEGRWLAFDVSYFVIICSFIALSLVYQNYTLDVVMVAIYFLMGVFESVFDFCINRDIYADKKPEAETDTAPLAESEVAK